MPVETKSLDVVAVNGAGDMNHHLTHIKDYGGSRLKTSQKGERIACIPSTTRRRYASRQLIG
jgi:hypothetical protein